MTLDDAMESAELDQVEEACAAPGLDDEMTGFVLASHRFGGAGPDLLRAMLERGCEVRDYVENKVRFRKLMAEGG